MARIVIIGSGIAGLFASLRLADAGHTVTVITKQRPVDSSTNWAQGGIAAPFSKDDSNESHIQDTIATAKGLADLNVVKEIISESEKTSEDTPKEKKPEKAKKTKKDKEEDSN